MPVQTQVQMRRDTAANWTSANPVLASGEWGIETDTRLVKIGNGSAAWNSLNYSTGPALDEVIPTDPTGWYFNGNSLVLTEGWSFNNNTLSAPDSNALDITGDLELECILENYDWTRTGTNNPFVAKYATGQRSWTFRITNGAKTLNFVWSADGTNINTANSTADIPTDTNGVKVEFDVNNGASGRTVKFYTSNNLGSTWTQLGNDVTSAGVTSIFSGTAPLTIAADPLSGGLYAGNVKRVKVRNGIGGTTVFDANFETVPSDSFAFTESSANAATVTLTTTRYSFGVPGATLTGTSTAAVNQNTTYYFPFTVRGKPITLKHFGVECTTAGASNVTSRIAIHLADNQLQPTGAPIIQSGAFTVSNTGAAIYRIRVTPTVLNPGNYLILFNVNNGFTGRYWFNPNVFAPNTLGANLIALRTVSQTLSGDFPTTPVKWNVASGANSAGRHYVLLGWS